MCVWLSRRLWFFFFSSRRRHTRFKCDWSSDVCSSDLGEIRLVETQPGRRLDEARRAEARLGHGGCGVGRRGVRGRGGKGNARRRHPPPCPPLAGTPHPHVHNPSAAGLAEERGGGPPDTTWAAGTPLY